MTRLDFLEALSAFSKDAIKDLLLKVRIQQADEEPTRRPADVYMMRLPDSRKAEKKAPYIIHQIITGRDTRPEGERMTSQVVVRSIFCVYNDDEQEGALDLLNLMERLRISLLEQVLIADRYQLDLDAGVEMIIYPENTAPYYAGEMATTWIIPPVERQVRIW